MAVRTAAIAANAAARAVNAEAVVIADFIPIRLAMLRCLI
jgi:hypothetical protein